MHTRTGHMCYKWERKNKQPQTHMIVALMLAHVSIYTGARNAVQIEFVGIGHRTRQIGHWYSGSISISSVLPVPEDAMENRDNCSSLRIAASFASTA